jgi:hypothetical protein
MKKLSNIYFFYDYWSIFKRRYRDLDRRSSGKTKRKYHAAKLKDKKLTYAEFIDWCWDKNNFKTFEDLYKQWEDNNFIKKYSPSIDRIDSQGTYTLDNIQWLSLGENARKHDK